MEVVMTPGLYGLIALWLTFFLLHSLLASNPVKESITKRLGISLRTYRLQYVILSILHLLLIFAFTAFLDSNYLIQPGPWSNYLGLMLGGLGAVIVLKAFKSYDGKAFFGLSDLSGEQRFTTEGLLKHVRHPLYSGSIVLLLGFLIYIPNVGNLISVSLMIVYFIIGIRFEEKKLIKQFGKDYEDYKKSTPMLVPRIFN
jgi:protein-S-isoprenylcysteine O-methyltransferase Ste14